jgi:hypothetical protein
MQVLSAGTLVTIVLLWKVLGGQGVEITGRSGSRYRGEGTIRHRAMAQGQVYLAHLGRYGHLF